MIKIELTSVLVEDQAVALAFYTETLGLRKSQDIPVGEFRWLTVRSPDGGDTEVSLEPTSNPAAKTYQQALYQQNIPITAFETDDIHAEYERLHAAGVEFSMEPTEAGPTKLAVFADTCGNWIQIYQPTE